MKYYVDFKLGDMFYDKEYQCMCCIVDPNDVDWGAEYNEHIRSKGRVVLYLDEHQEQYISIANAYEKLTKDKNLIPLTEDEIRMYQMITPHIDFTHWRKLYGRA